jgi:hypothetical protein
VRIDPVALSAVAALITAIGVAVATMYSNRSARRLQGLEHARENRHLDGTEYTMVVVDMRRQLEETRADLAAEKVARRVAVDGVSGRLLAAYRYIRALAALLRQHGIEAPPVPDELDIPIW